MGGLFSGHLNRLLATPLEGLAAIHVLLAIGIGLGIWAGLWTADQAVAFLTPIYGSIAVVGIKILGPIADVVIMGALAVALHNWRRALEIGIAAGVVALVSWHFGGQDWMSSLPSLLAHHKGA